MSALEIVSAEIAVAGLGFPEGPLVLGPGRVAWVEQYPGRVAVLDDGEARTLAHVGGAPNGLALAPDGRIFVAQNGGKLGDWQSPQRQPPSIVALDPVSGVAEVVTTTAGGRPLRRPNDLCVAPDGAIWFTDPGDYDPGGDVRGWICRHADGATEIVRELGNVYPNGIGFDGDGRVLWVETHTHVLRVLEGDAVVADLGPDGTGDGFAIAADGTVVVASVFSGGLHVVAPGADGEREVAQLSWAEDLILSNCAFDGTTLWATDATTAWDRSDDFAGRLWRLETNLDGGSAR
ncbi:SMP-30/gluconolactonase/LRE family protein [Conexibacter woesei]|uniref:SMP-30/Gluconolaconase/LRE domain protein n=1 Tax=Conexibacter woesei (strain DSM 14684 / CCUG 47730 / CIP 108061 / JCM 11494 / NBRC 100937 / ID131577) TaxID=469383 RepID=D3F9U8_CONWI|nr:SMP-30/gluconolactonase/LRE family protein [Conexibacter woesei]ADB51160.1 SMP-30/Gluconolaconase/LRE domain protein [Conexibacter woesei DSM 14684]